MNLPGSRRLARLAAGGLVAAAILAAPLAAPVRAEAVPGAVSLSVVVVIDQSGSMQSNDPQTLNADGSAQNAGWRFVATNLLAEWLSIDQTGARHQMSVIMFGTDAKVVFPIQDIQPADARATLKKSLAENNRSMGYTDIVKALRLARSELDKGRSGAGVKQAVIFLSDGVCEPGEANNPAQTAECNRQTRELAQRQFADSAHPIFTIALTSEAVKRDPASLLYKNLWQEIAVMSGGDYFEPSRTGVELMNAFVGIQQRLFGLPAQSPASPVSAPQTLGFDVPPNLAQVAFSVIKFDPAVGVTLLRPDGKPADPNEPGLAWSRSDLTESYNVLKPPAGRWQVRLTGSGLASVLMTPFIKTVALVDRLSPRAAQPQGKPMALRVRVLDAGQAPVQLPDLTVTAWAPDGRAERLNLREEGGVYAGVLSNTSQVGTYELGFTTATLSQTLATQYVRVVAAPWIALDEPRADRVYPSNQAVPVRAEVLANGRLAPGPRPDERLEVIARLINASGQVVDSQIARPSTAGFYSATLAAAGNGRYAVQAQLTYLSPAGETFTDVTEAPVVVDGVAEWAAPSDATAAPPLTVFGARLTPEGLAISAAAIAGLLLLSQAALALALRGTQRVYRQALAQQAAAVHAQRALEASPALETPAGWEPIASQLVADALDEPVSIDTEAGFLDVVTEPYLKFTLLRNGGGVPEAREIVFTTAPDMLRKIHLIRPGDRVADVSRQSEEAHLDVWMLWRAALASRSLAPVVPPSNVRWYVIARRAPRTSARRSLPGSQEPAARLFGTARKAGG